ncbi:MAG: MFS transporter [Phycisphaerae bacterium]|nr:MFS transporter [Phycisphaerae bacterium]
MRSARLSLFVLLAINLFNYIDRYILAAVEPRIREAFFAKDDPDAATKLGVLGSAFMISYMAIAPVFGWLGDRTRRWTIIGLGAIAWSLASGASGLATTFTALLITRVFVGIGEAAYGPTAPTVIADLYPVHRRGAVLSWFYVAIPVGTAIGYGVGTVVAAKTDSWQWPFYVVVPWGIALGVWAMFRPEPARGLSDRVDSKRKMSLADVLILVKTRSYLFNLAGMTAMTFALGGISFWIRTYVNEYRGLNNEAAVGTTFGAIVVVTGLSATLFGGWLSDRLRARFGGSYFLVSAVGMLIGFPLFLCVLYVPFPWAWGFLAAAVFCLFLNTGPSNTIIANVTPASLRSTAYAVSIFTIHALGDVISPPIIGRICDATRTAALPHGDMNKAFLVISLAMLASGVLWALGAKFLAEDTARASGAGGAPGA